MSCQCRVNDIVILTLAIHNEKNAIKESEMKQPDLGLKVTELRQQKGMTQEALAEFCEVSTRTIQRIESGEVDPRLFTINRLSEVLEFDFGEDNEPNEKLWLAVLHLSSIAPLIIIALLVWSWKKTRSYKIDRQGRDVLNFQITMFLMLLAAAMVLIVAPLVIYGVGMEPGTYRPEGFLWAVMLVPLPLMFVGIFTTLQSLINAIKSLSDRPYRYLLSIPFVR